MIETIVEETRGNEYSIKDISDNECASDNAAGVQFHKKNKKLLEVLTLLLAGPILPFIHFFEEKLADDKEFLQFKQYATTNSNIFYDFARYMSKNYIFYVNKADPNFSKSKNKLHTKPEFEKLLKENANNIFDARVIRRRFLEFVNKHMARALSEAPVNMNSKRISAQYVDPNVSQNFITGSGLQQEHSDNLMNPMRAEKYAKLPSSKFIKPMLKIVVM